MQPLKSERVTEGGIVIPESEAEKYDIAAVKAKVIAIGPLAFEAEKQHEKSFWVQISAIPVLVQLLRWRNMLVMKSKWIRTLCVS